jgi:large subunit ribosomal protein L17
MLANMVTSLFDNERIRTTDAKAKEARRQAERLITRAKKGYAAYQEHQSLKDAGKEAESNQMQAVALAHWRVASRVVRKKSVLKKLFDTIAPQYMDREGGYTRILKVGSRLGDNARTVILELVGREAAREERLKTDKKKAEKGEAPAKDKGKAKSKRDKKSTKKESKKTAAEKTIKDTKEEKEKKPKKSKAKGASEEEEA